MASLGVFSDDWLNVWSDVLLLRKVHSSVCHEQQSEFISIIAVHHCYFAAAQRTFYLSFDTTVVSKCLFFF